MQEKGAGQNVNVQKQNVPKLKSRNVLAIQYWVHFDFSIDYIMTSICRSPLGTF